MNRIFKCFLTGLALVLMVACTTPGKNIQLAQRVCKPDGLCIQARGDTLELFYQKHDQKHGKYFRYSGTCLSVKGRYKKGLQAGKWVYYDCEGRVAAIQHYKKGEVVKMKLNNLVW